MRLIDRVDELVNQHGGVRKAARALQIDAAYLLRIGKGEKVNPSAAILRKLGLRKVTTYELIGNALAEYDKAKQS